MADDCDDGIGIDETAAIAQDGVGVIERRQDAIPGADFNRAEDALDELARSDPKHAPLGLIVLVLLGHQDPAGGDGGRLDRFYENVVSK